MTTILDYILYLDLIRSTQWPMPKLLDEKRGDGWEEHWRHWASLHTAQKVLLIMLLGSATEKDAIRHILDARPDRVTWQQLISACFAPELWAAPTLAMDRKNHRQKQKERSI